MRRTILIFLIIFLSFTYAVFSSKVFEINETQKIQLGLKANDPDNDVLTYSFSKPLNRIGEWQTTYGDAGKYNVTITVSDGQSKATESVMIIVHRKDESPIVEKFKPIENEISLDEGMQLKFDILASDLNNDELQYIWFLGDKEVSRGRELIFDTGYQDSGKYLIKVVISDGSNIISHFWDVEVREIDLDSLLAAIPDISVEETQTARINLPNLKKLGLNVTISDPIGVNNKWKTNYNDSGKYEATITVDGKGYHGDKKIQIEVINKDRPPKFIDLNNVNSDEDQEMIIKIQAVDPDGDAVIYSIEDMPDGADFSNNIFSWKPGFDYVQKNDDLDYIWDKFRILRKIQNIAFIAQSNDMITRKVIGITINDVNRPFVLDGINDIIVDEGQEIIIEPTYTDPDNDKVYFSYSGFMTNSRKKTNYDSAGSYLVKMTSSDDYFTDSKLINIRVRDVNRKPMLEKIKDVSTNEAEPITIILVGTDPDGDPLTYSTGRIPNGAQLKDNIFTWTPGYDFVTNTSSDDVFIEFTVSDGRDTDSKKIKIVVNNVNQAPVILDFSDTLIAVKDIPILFEIDAVDPDGGELKYNWEFGIFDKFEGSSKHQRIFTSTGKKSVKVSVSDGLMESSKIWQVEVV